MMPGVQIIQAEYVRQRQTDHQKPENDDIFDLTAEARNYIAVADTALIEGGKRDWDCHRAAKRDLVVAGALVARAIEAINRELENETND